MKNYNKTKFTVVSDFMINTINLQKIHPFNKTNNDNYILTAYNEAKDFGYNNTLPLVKLMIETDKNFGNLITVEPFEKFKIIKIIKWDGNDRFILFETDNYYYYFNFCTS